MKVQNTLTPQFIDGQLRAIGDDRRMLINSVWNDGSLVEVIIQAKDGLRTSMMVRGDELSMAISNALNRPWNGRK